MGTPTGSRQSATRPYSGLQHTFLMELAMQEAPILEDQHNIGTSESLIANAPAGTLPPIILHLEVRLFPSANIRLDSITRWVHEWLHANFISLSLAQDITCFGTFTQNSCCFIPLMRSVDGSPLIAESVEVISVVEATGSTAGVLYLEQVTLGIHAYKLHAETPTSGGVSQSDRDGGEEEQPSSRVTVLPSKGLDGLWEL